MSSRNINDLTDDFKIEVQNFLDELKKANLDVLITCTLRSNEEQDALYAQGRKTLDEVNSLRRNVNLAPISERENSRHVTNASAGKSYHNTGRAIDIVPVNCGKLVWDINSELWNKIGAIGVSLGLNWAGNWERFPEYPHFQQKDE